MAGLGTGLKGRGRLAAVRFRVRAAGEARIALQAVRARDGANRPLTLAVTNALAPVIHYATGIGPVFPNPFRSSLNVSFSLAREARTRVVVYDLAGRAVRHLADGMRPAGFHVLTWDGRGDIGYQAAAGFYVVRFEAGEVRQTRRVQLIR